MTAEGPMTMNDGEANAAKPYHLTGSRPWSIR